MCLTSSLSLRSCVCLTCSLFPTPRLLPTASQVEWDGDYSSRVEVCDIPASERLSFKLSPEDAVWVDAIEAMRVASGRPGDAR